MENPKLFDLTRYQCPDLTGRGRILSRKTKAKSPIQSLKEQKSQGREICISVKTEYILDSLILQRVEKILCESKEGLLDVEVAVACALDVPIAKIYLAALQNEGKIIVTREELWKVKHK